MESTEEKQEIKKQTITKEINQWRMPNCRFARQDIRKSRCSTIGVPEGLKEKIISLKETPEESYRDVIERLIKEHHFLAILKKKLKGQQGAEE